MLLGVKLELWLPEQGFDGVYDWRQRMLTRLNAVVRNLGNQR